MDSLISVVKREFKKHIYKIVIVIHKFIFLDQVCLIIVYLATFRSLRSPYKRYISLKEATISKVIKDTIKI